MPFQAYELSDLRSWSTARFYMPQSNVACVPISTSGFCMDLVPADCGNALRIAGHVVSRDLTRLTQNPAALILVGWMVAWL